MKLILLDMTLNVSKRNILNPPSALKRPTKPSSEENVTAPLTTSTDGTIES